MTEIKERCHAENDCELVAELYTNISRMQQELSALRKQFVIQNENYEFYKTSIVHLQRELDKKTKRLVLAKSELMEARKRIATFEISYKTISRLDKLVEELREQARWIPVTERLPEECTDVLILNCFGNIRIGFHNGDRWIDNTSTRTPPVTHWRPLPPAPEECEG